MKFSAATEAKVIEAIKANPSAHIVFDDSVYRGDNNIVVHRWNQQMLLHRYLYYRIRGQVMRSIFLLPDCDRPGCMNPYHRRKTRYPHRDYSDRCRNGHLYPEPRLEGKVKCLQCYVNRTDHTPQRDPNGPQTNALRTHCPQNHEYTEQNTYLYTDSKGQTRRYCKTCQLDRTRARRKASS